jgi:hypothetical protein
MKRFLALVLSLLLLAAFTVGCKPSETPKPAEAPAPAPAPEQAAPAPEKAAPAPAPEKPAAPEKAKGH